MSQNLKDLQSKASAATDSGVAFFGGLDDNFQLIIRCPIHVYCAIKKSLSGSFHDLNSRYFSGSVTISHLALEQFRGTFIYVSKHGKAKKFNAAFVYPLQSDYFVLPEEYAKLMALCGLMDLAKYKYYDKKDRSIRQLLNCFTLPALSPDTGLESAFCCLSAIKN